jgi:hypothetical protein
MSEIDNISDLEKLMRLYADKAKENRDCYNYLRITEITVAVFIPFLATTNVPIIIIGFLGVLIVVIQGIQGLYQYQKAWILYSSIVVKMRREIVLYNSLCEPYKSREYRDALLSVNIHNIVSSTELEMTEIIIDSGKKTKINIDSVKKTETNIDSRKKTEII